MTVNKMSCRGFITLPLMAWGAIAAAVALAGMGIAVKVQSSRLETCKTEFVAFQDRVKALGEAAQEKAETERLRQEKLLKDSETKNAKLTTDLSATNRRLRDARSRSSIVPAAPEASAKPSLACFDRTLIESALRRFDEGVTRLVDEGSENTLRLKMSVEWASAALDPPPP